jgi:hypothetical protein
MIPKILWMYWDGGYESINEVSRRCFESWKYHNHDWDIRFLDNDNVTEYFDLGDWTLPDGQKTSEVLRIHLLSKYGGVYSDIDVFCCKPLDEWIHDSNPEGFFAFDLPGTRRIISTWFFASTKGNYFTQLYCEEIEKYWSNRTIADEYFWLQYVLKPVFDSDREAKRIWDSCNKISAWDCLIFRPNRDSTRIPFNLPPNDKAKAILSKNKEPVYKLNRRVEDLDVGCILDILDG